MANPRDIRRLAMQVLYQVDLRGEADPAAVRAFVDDSYDRPQVIEPAVALALSAWARRDEADRLATELAPDWPTHRQPAVDRALLRLAYYEMASRRTPATVAINEAVELAKEYCAEQSPPFINAVLDKMQHRLPEPGEAGEAEAPADLGGTSGDAQAPPAQPQAQEQPPQDPWLHDALRKERAEDDNRGEPS